MCAVADVTFSLLTSGFVLSPFTLLPRFQSVLSVQFVLPVRLLLDRLWLATVHDVSSNMHQVINPSRPSPCFSYCKRQKLGVEAWERGYRNMLLRRQQKDKLLIITVIFEKRVWYFLSKTVRPSNIPIHCSPSRHSQSDSCIMSNYLLLAFPFSVSFTSVLPLLLSISNS